MFRTLTAVATLAVLTTTPRLQAGEPSPEKPAPPRQYEVAEARNLTYFAGEDDPDLERHRLDVFSPKGLKDCPVVFFVHGGAWMVGRKDDYLGIFGYGSIARCLARRGVVVVLPNYRLTPRVRHPEHIKDVAHAFAWTCTNVARYGGDPARIVVLGHSAGGHLVSLLTTDEKYLRAEGRNRKDIRGVIGVCGVYCVEDLEFKMSASSPGEWLSYDAKVSPFAMVFGTDPEVLKQASPVTHVEPGLPPFLLMNAGFDYPRLPQMTRAFASALEENCCDVEVKVVPWRTHETVVFDIMHRTAEPAFVEAVVGFVDRHGGARQGK
jgi:acetyl esterase/lipase